jgi:hypothetical protein
MALTGLHKDYVRRLQAVRLGNNGQPLPQPMLPATYENERDWFLKQRENLGLYNGRNRAEGLNPYSDTSIAIGYGFDLLHDPTVILITI